MGIVLLEVTQPQEVGQVGHFKILERQAVLEEVADKEQLVVLEYQDKETQEVVGHIEEVAVAAEKVVLLPLGTAVAGLLIVGLAQAY